MATSKQNKQNKPTVYTEAYTGKTGKESLLISVPEDDIDTTTAHAIGMGAGFGPELSGYYVRWASLDGHGAEIADRIAVLIGGSVESVE